MNLPNTLSIIRCFLVPVFVATLLLMRNAGVWGYVVPALVYGLTAFTDMLDGKIARKHNLVTDFGKFIDPLADKFMVLSSMIAILAWMFLRGKTVMALIFVWVVMLILLRELGVTSIRLVVAGKSGIVVAASILGKIKTVSQMVGTAIILVEPILPFFSEYNILTYVAMAVMSFTTVFSGIDYLKAYMPYIDSNK
jgi:CDP-diacylglycerol--glycerol-3-phosphate 3-phosphatidyltransferase